MTAPRWERVQELFAAALDQPTGARAAYVAGATDDAAVRNDVLALLRSHDSQGRLDSLTDYLGTIGARDGPDPLERLRAALVDRYRIDREVGRGGNAIVYLAQDLKHKREVALKLLKPEIAATVGPARFLREIETAARLTHPHILPVHDSGEAGGLIYYVMPLVRGESLRDRLNRDRPLPLDETVRITHEIADALGHAHSHAVIHRDIKPENILFIEGHALVSDFGIARVAVTGDIRLTEPGLIMGTPAYMSPEQSESRRVDARSDVYSLGCVVFEMLGGQPPFTGATPRAVMARHVQERVPPLQALQPSVTPALQAVVEKALAKRPADRYATAVAFAVALERASGSRESLLAKLLRRLRM